MATIVINIPTIKLPKVSKKKAIIGSLLAVLIVPTLLWFILALLVGLFGVPVTSGVHSTLTMLDNMSLPFYIWDTVSDAIKLHNIKAGYMSVGNN